MSHNSPAINWSQYLQTELAYVTPWLATLGYTLAEHQPHILGERFLMQAVTTTGGQKLILLGHNKDGTRVVIKVTSSPDGKQEIQHERRCRARINALNFSYGVFDAPSELLFLEKNNYLVSIQEYIEQTSTFLERPLLEQFNYALTGFKAQAQAQITTRRHFKSIATDFGHYDVHDYLRNATNFIVSLHDNPSLRTSALAEAGALLTAQQERISQYTGFLTHTDFVPHNFRIRDGKLYLLDFSSIRFGNKHEGWARFLNFMTLYNPALEEALLRYVEQNYASEERTSLQLMRIYRLLEILSYYTNATKKSTYNLQTLNQKRVLFWQEVLCAELRNVRVSKAIVSEYQAARNTLRSFDEHLRQNGLH